MNYSTLYAADKTLLMVFNGSHCPFVDRLAVTLTCAYMWIPLYIALLLLVINNHKTVAQISLVIGMALLAIVLSEGMADLIVKPLVARLRPIHDTLMQDRVQVVNNYRVEGYSFFSAHASNTMAVAVFFSLLVKDRLFACTLIVWALVNCWTRLYLGVHYPSDIIVGVVWGSISGLFAYTIYNKVKDTRRLSVSDNAATTDMAYRRSDINRVICVMALLVIFAIIFSLI